MNRIVEAVPNFSEGRRDYVIKAITEAASGETGAWVLDCETDPDHNRSVVTIAGAPASVLKAVFAAMEMATRHIDLNRHEGQHPRMGATDVVPFVPVEGVDMEDCRLLARELGRQAGEKLGIPVFLYGEAATVPARRNLAAVRKGEFEGLREAIGTDPDRLPDFGPHEIHATAGATAVGARFFLIAYNVNLATDDVKIAKQIAREIREASGGLPGVRALGMYIAEKNIAQVSMNLVDYRQTSPAKVMAVIDQKARERGCEVLESELIGLVPQDALLLSAAEALKIRDFHPEAVIEKNLRQRLE